MKITWSLFIFVVLNNLIATNEYEYELRINDECKTLYEILHNLQNCCIKFDKTFQRATYFLDHKKYKKIRQEFYKSFYFFVKKIQKIILITQHKDRSIRVSFLESIRGNKGEKLIEIYINNFLSCIISYEYSIVMIEQSIVYYHNIIRDLRNILDLLENRLNEFKKYLITIKN